MPTDLTGRPKPSNIADPDHEGDMMPPAYDSAADATDTDAE